MYPMLSTHYLLSKMFYRPFISFEESLYSHSKSLASVNIYSSLFYLLLDNIHYPILAFKLTYLHYGRGIIRSNICNGCRTYEHIVAFEGVFLYISIIKGYITIILYSLKYLNKFSNT